MGFFSKIKNALKKTKDAVGYKLNKLFTGGVLNDDFYDELENILVSSDMGAELTMDVLERLRDTVDEKLIRNTEDVKVELKQAIADIVGQYEPPKYEFPLVIMVVGVNGVGKTTAVGKLANLFREQGKSVLIAAADTFRAAAVGQLEIWAERAKVRIVKHSEGADPGAVVFDAISSAKAKNTDVLLIDTAGRLHNKKNLMDELGKINKIVASQMPNAMFLKFIVLDATTGQNAVAQAEAFDGMVDIDGIVLTKLDGTAKGGVVCAISNKMHVPVVYVGTGEGIEDIVGFDVGEFVDGLMGG